MYKLVIFKKEAKKEKKKKKKKRDCSKFPKQHDKTLFPNHKFMFYKDIFR